jgi:hypothetical protein
MSDYSKYGEEVMKRERVRHNLARAQAGLVRCGVENAVPRDPQGKAALKALTHAIDVLEELLR